MTAIGRKRICVLGRQRVTVSRGYPSGPNALACNAIWLDELAGRQIVSTMSADHPHLTNQLPGPTHQTTHILMDAVGPL